VQAAKVAPLLGPSGASPCGPTAPSKIARGDFVAAGSEGTVRTEVAGCDFERTARSGGGEARRRQDARE